MFSIYTSLKIKLAFKRICMLSPLRLLPFPAATLPSVFTTKEQDKCPINNNCRALLGLKAVIYKLPVVATCLDP